MASVTVLEFAAGSPKRAVRKRDIISIRVARMAIFYLALDKKKIVLKNGFTP